MKIFTALLLAALLSLTLSLRALDPDPGALRHVSVQLSSAELLSLSGGGTSLPIVPAPGPGYFLVPAFWSANYVYGTMPYLFGDDSQDALLLNFPSGSTTNIAMPVMGFLDQTQSELFTNAATGIFAGFGINAPSAVGLNAPLELSLAGDVPTISGGDGSLDIEVWYSISAGH